MHHAYIYVRLLGYYGAVRVPHVEDVAMDFAKQGRAASDPNVASMIRARSSTLNDMGYKSFLGPMRPGQPRRIRHQSKLTGEGVMAVLLKLDRVVQNGKVGAGDLEDALGSDLMFPHVCDTLMTLGFVIWEGELSARSSANVRTI